MPRSRLLAALLIANLLCLGLLNGLGLPVGALIPALPLLAAAAWALLRSAVVRPAPCRPPRAAFACASAAFVLLTLPRLPYLSEWLPGAMVLAQADDYARLAQLISMTLGGFYPLPHPSNQAFLLSHYYTALFPIAWLKLAFPVLTLKDSIFLGNLLYNALFVLALLEVAPRLLRRRTGVSLLVFLLTLFGGLDILAGHWTPFEHTELWLSSRLGRNREFSSFYTAGYWTLHHMAAVWSVLLAYVFSRELRFTSKWPKPLALGWLLTAALASSAFVVLSLPLLAWRELWSLWKRLLQTRMIAPVAAAALVPLWLSTQRLDPAAFWWKPVALSLPVYLLAVFVVDLAGIPLVVAARWRSLARSERRWLLGALAFFASTWGLESIGFNNYAMRGALLPSVALMLIFARHVTLPRPAILLAAVAALTTIKEAATMTNATLQHSSLYWELRGLAVPHEIACRMRAAYPKLARDNASRYYEPDPGDRRSVEKFNAEKLIRDLPVDQMLLPELELARRR